jgi:hypothetical protein
MALYIRSAEVDRLAHELAEATGETLTEAVGAALRERLRRVRPLGESPEHRRRWEEAHRIILEARAECLAHGVVAPTKEEIEEMLGMDY